MHTESRLSASLIFQSDPHSQAFDRLEVKNVGISALSQVALHLSNERNVTTLRFSGYDYEAITAMLSNDRIVGSMRELEFADPVDQTLLQFIATLSAVDDRLLAQVAAAVGEEVTEVSSYVSASAGVSQIESLLLTLNPPTNERERGFGCFGVPIDLRALGESTALGALRRLWLVVEHPGNEGLEAEQYCRLEEFARCSGLPELREIAIKSAPYSDLFFSRDLPHVLISELNAQRAAGNAVFPKLEWINGERLEPRL